MAERKKENAKMRTPGTRVSHETTIVPVKVKIVLIARQKSVHKTTCRYFCWSRTNKAQFILYHVFWSHESNFY